jgi:ADP-heptose:LPS heptosyltransferase
MNNKIQKLYISCRIKNYRNDNPTDTDNGNVVLVRLDAIGDFIMSYSIFKEYRNYYKDKHIILICSLACKVLAEEWKIADEIYPIDMNRYRKDKDYFVSVNNGIGNITTNMVIQLASHRSVYMEYLVGLIKSNMKIALKRDNNKSIVRKSWNKVYNVLVPYEGMMDFDIKKNFYLFNYITKQNKEVYQALLPQISMSPIKCDNYFIVAQGGSFQAKKWDNEKYSSVINYILQSIGIKCCLIGGSGDLEDGNEICSKVKDKDKLINLIGKTTLTECIEIIRGANFIITNDTSFVHAAVAVNTRSICIVGGWHYGRFLPYDLHDMNEIKYLPLVAYRMMDCYCCNFKNPRCKNMRKKDCGQKLPCIDNIEVEDVIKLVDEYL